MQNHKKNDSKFSKPVPNFSKSTNMTDIISAQNNILSAIEKWDAKSYIHLNKDDIFILENSISKHSDTKSMIVLATALGHGWVKSSNSEKALDLFHNALLLGDLNACLPIANFVAAKDQSDHSLMFQSLILQFGASHGIEECSIAFNKRKNFFDNIPNNTIPGYSFYGEKNPFFNLSPLLNRLEWRFNEK